MIELYVDGERHLLVRYPERWHLIGTVLDCVTVSLWIYDLCKGNINFG